MSGTRRWRVSLVAALAAVTIGLVASCGDDEEAVDSGTGTGVTTPPTAPPTATAPTATTAPSEPLVVPIRAAEQALAFQETEYSVPQGLITLSMSNPSSTPHNIALDDPVNVEGDVVGQGGVSEVTAELPPGTYTYFCSVPGHREGGMQGTLTVRAETRPTTVIVG